MFVFFRVYKLFLNYEDKDNVYLLQKQYIFSKLKDFFSVEIKLIFWVFYAKKPIHFNVLIEKVSAS
jgi:hypothetical protein